jgi:phosphoribosylformimino-5-aminoimidazole carboxamide ribotide isomerase
MLVVFVVQFVFKDGKMDAKRLKQLVDLIGKERLVLDLSCRKKDGHYMVVTDRWQRFSDLALNEATLAMLAASADEFLVHGVDVEGMRLGIDDELVSILGKWSPIPVTYAGGVNTLADLERIKSAGFGGVDFTVGSALDIFGGDLQYRDVVSWHNQQLVATQ